MTFRPLPFALLATSLLSTPALHAELGSVAPVTLGLTVTSVVGALPDADADGQPDWEKETQSATKYTYEYKTKSVTSKLTNAVFLNELVKSQVIADTNYSLVTAFDDDGVPLGFYLVRKGESPIVTTPVDVTAYLYFYSMADSFLVATAAKYTQQLSGSVVTSEDYKSTVTLKGPVQLGILPMQGAGMYNATFGYHSGLDIYLLSSAKITSVAGAYLEPEDDEQPVSVEGSITFGASKPMDVAIFPVPAE